MAARCALLRGGGLTRLRSATAAHRSEVEVRLSSAGGSHRLGEVVLGTVIGVVGRRDAVSHGWSDGTGKSGREAAEDPIRSEEMRGTSVISVLLDASVKQGSGTVCHNCMQLSLEASRACAAAVAVYMCAS